MTKKHFIALANIIREHNSNDDYPFTAGQLEVLAEFCKSQNKQFNTQRWLDYIAGKCGPNGGKK